jgi:DNA-binding transcriptional LysR family regulator
LVPAEAADATALLTAQADAGLIRMPVDRTEYQAIPLYTETTVVVFPAITCSPRPTT